MGSTTGSTTATARSIPEMGETIGATGIRQKGKPICPSDARDSHHELEREIFNWYRAFYTDPEAEYWVKTPWGASSGGESGGAGTVWDDTPVAKIMKAPDPLFGISAGCEEYLGTTRFDYRIAWAQNGEGVQPMPEEDYMTDIEQPTLLDVELMFGYVYYEWIRARKNGEVSEWSDVASYEWNG